MQGCAPGCMGAQQSGLPSGVRDTGTQRDRLLGAPLRLREAMWGTPSGLPLRPRLSRVSVLFEGL